MEDLSSTPIEQWTESMVGKWLASIGVKEHYIKKLEEEEVDGRVLCDITENFLKEKAGMKSGPILLIMKNKEKLIKSLQNVEKQTNKTEHKKSSKTTAQEASSIQNVSVISTPKKDDLQHVPTVKRDTNPRPFGKNGSDYTYTKHDVLQPETGVIDLITPCHEYKAFTIAATLDRQRLQAKLANEVLKFATGCINIRSNGTIHFGVMDSRDTTEHVHGEIVGIPIKEKDMYTDALDYIEKSFLASDSELIRQCIRPPEFIRVVEPKSQEEHYVVEFDIVPTLSIVKNKVFSVHLPNFKEKSNKIEYVNKTIYCRIGSKTEPVSEPNEFYQAVCMRDKQRQEAEQAINFTTPGLCQDLGRKLTMLVTCGKKQMEKEKWYILVTNRFSKDDLTHIDFLLNMKIFCVFDFDPDSKVSGLCKEYDKHHKVNLHFLRDYKVLSSMSIREAENHLSLFDQTSWIFCNGRNDFKGNEYPCDENTWSKTKKTHLKECVSIICKSFLAKGSFLVIFLLTSPIERPLFNTFDEFFTDMNGHEDIICISESEENFRKWEAFALGLCDKDTVHNSSVVGMKMSHVNTTLLKIQTKTIKATKLLPIYVKGECCLETREEESMFSLEILSANQCDDTSHELSKSEKEEIERQFYHGAKVTWMNLWLAEKKYVGEVIQRDAYNEVTRLLNDSLKWSVDQMPVSCINIYHHPGSGGSTVARQVLWNQRKELRCAVVKPSSPVGTVSEHAVKLREYEEKDPQKCLPVLLLLEDCDKEYIEDLKNELEGAVRIKKIARTLCFLLLSCRRSYTPEKMCKESPLLNVSVTHKLSPEEKRQFEGKRKNLELRFKPEFILTFILMGLEFNDKIISKYVETFVKHLLQDMDRASVVTQLILYVALLNTYVENSFISRSHCESFLGLSVAMDRFRQHAFESALGEQAKLILIVLRDERTHIESIRIIHTLVAKEILYQLLVDKRQSDLALELLNNDALFENRFGRDDYRKFLRALFMRRYKISKGDQSDSFFSPLIEHVRKNEVPEKAIELLNQAYKRFNEDAFFAQQLARLSYTYERFKEAKEWANTAVNKLPNNSYILDTKGQVYKKWFTAKCKAIEDTHKTAEMTADAIETALTAIECFQTCQKAAKEETETMNNSGFFAVVEVGLSLLTLVSSLRVFSKKRNESSEFLKYFLTEHIPPEVEKPWENLHFRLKSLHSVMRDALEWISEDLSYFQTDFNADEDETSANSELTVRRPKHWLITKCFAYGKFFSGALSSTVPAHLNADDLTPFAKQNFIFQLGGGTMTSIFSILDQKDKDRVKVFKDIISLYPENPINTKMPQVDLVNYIATHFALGTLNTQSDILVPINELQKCTSWFLQDKQNKCLSNACFLSVLLLWPEEHDSDDVKEEKYEKVLLAVENLQKTYYNKIKDMPYRRKRIYTHFLLGNGVGYQKFVHKSMIENFVKIPTVSERRIKWFRGELWKAPEIAKVLKRVTGWTENGKVYIEGPKRNKLEIHSLFVPSVPHSNENVTFYLGFAFRGPVAYDITVMP